MISISEAVVADAAEILALQKLCYQSEAQLNGDFQIPPLLQDLASMQEDFAQQRILKAVCDGRIVGSVRAREREGTCHIGRVIVHPDLQNRGLGTRLMGEIEARFPAVSRFELFTGQKSERNLHLYQKLGFVPLRQERLSPQTTLVFLEKHVAR
jgi:ribosomal protein S18 acetylase RimI-like enzyme